MSAGHTIGHKTITGFGDLAINDKGKLVRSSGLSPGVPEFSRNQAPGGDQRYYRQKTLIGISGLVTNNAGAIAFLGSFSDGTLGIVARRVNDDSGEMTTT